MKEVAEQVRNIVVYRYRYSIIQYCARCVLSLATYFFYYFETLHLRSYKCFLHCKYV
jgi:hypothetical protein